MDASIALQQRPRPQNLFLSNPSTCSDIKCSTAALKPITGSEWSISLRSITSATLKQGPAVDAEPKSASALAQEYKDRIAAILLRKKIRTPRPTSQVLEVASDGDSEENRVPSSQNSTSGTKNSVDSNQRELSAEFEDSEAKRASELLHEEISILTKELEESSMTIAKKDKEISELSSQIGHHQKEIDALKNQSNEEGQKFLEAQEKCKDLQAKLEASEAEKNQLLENHKHIENELRALEQERDSLRAGLEERDSQIRTITHEKEEMKKNLEAEIQNKIGELENIQAKYECIGKESADVKIFLDEKTQQIINLEAEIRALVQEQEKSGKITQQVHEAKVVINEFNQKLEISPQDELIPALHCLIQEFTKTQLTLKKESERIKDQQKTVEDMKKEADDLRTCTSDQIKSLQERAQSDLEKITNLEKEKSQLLEKLEVENKLRVELENLKDSFEAEKLEFQEKIQKLEISKEQVAKIQEEENALLLYKLEESAETYTKAVNEFEQQIVTKDQYIQALIFDVNQMKEFIVEHHGESIFEKDEKDEKETTATETVEETPEKEKEEEVVEEVAETQEEIAETQEEIAETQEEITETKEEEEEKASEEVQQTKEERKKVVIVVAKPVYNKYDSYNQNRGGYDRGYYGGGYYEKKKFDRPYKPYKNDYYRYFESKVENTQPEPVKEVVKEEKNVREEDPAFKQLEKMIIELNEKLISSERRAKKVLEEKLEEAAKVSEEKEQEFIRQIEMVQEEKKALLKKIDDMQWDRAYEYTQKMKTEKKEEVLDNSKAAASKKKNKK